MEQEHYNILTLITASAGVILGVINFLHARLWRNRIRIRADFNSKSLDSPDGFEFEIRNKSFLSVTITKVTLSPLRHFNSPMLFNEACVGEYPLVLMPHLLKPRTSVTVRLSDFSGKTFYTSTAPDMLRLRKQRYGFLFVETACGRTFRKKFGLYDNL